MRTIAFANITSWHTRRDGVLGTDALMCLLAETRVTQTQIARETHRAQEHGYCACFSAAQPHGAGVGAIVQSPFALQMLWSDPGGRAAVFLTWAGTHTLAVGVLYGHVRKEEHARTAALVEQIKDHIAPFSGVPCLIAGDFNMN
eukprot:2401469-Amphidinium_carterae.1